jgi:hypothetical protein
MKAAQPGCPAFEKIFDQEIPNQTNKRRKTTRYTTMKIIAAPAAASSDCIAP